MLTRKLVNYKDEIYKKRHELYPFLPRKHKNSIPEGEKLLGSIMSGLRRNTNNVKVVQRLASSLDLVKVRLYCK